MMRFQIEKIDVVHRFEKNGIWLRWYEDVKKRFLSSRSFHSDLCLGSTPLLSSASRFGAASNSWRTVERISFGKSDGNGDSSDLGCSLIWRGSLSLRSSASTSACCCLSTLYLATSKPCFLACLWKKFRNCLSRTSGSRYSCEETEDTTLMYIRAGEKEIKNMFKNGHSLI